MCARAIFWITFLAIGAATSGCTGGADTAITGFGNGNNIIGAAGVLERAARELARLEAVPQVSDEDLRNVYASLRSRALEGEPEAVLILTRLAALQRESD